MPHNDLWSSFLAVTDAIYDSSKMPLSGALNIPEKKIISAFIAFRDNKPLARLVVYEPNFTEETSVWCFGAFESINDSELCRHLFDTVINAAAAKCIKNIIGPMNGSTWENYRIALNWDYPTFFSEVYQPPYYAQLLIDAGFQTLAKYSTHLQSNISYAADKIQPLRTRLKQNGVTIRNMDLTNFEQEIVKLYPFITSAFAHNFLYSPIQFEDFRDKYRAQKKWLDTRFVYFAENEEKELIGLVVGYPDYFNQTNKTLIVKTVARNPDKKYNGIAQVLCANISDAANSLGFNRIIHAFMHQDNKSVNLSGFFSGEKLREYALYNRMVKQPLIEN